MKKQKWHKYIVWVHRPFLSLQKDWEVDNIFAIALLFYLDVFVQLVYFMIFASFLMSFVINLF